jgi:RNA-directed DNA polymerase
MEPVTGTRIGIRRSLSPLSTELAGITKRAQRQKDCQFENLFSLLTVPALKWSFSQLRKNASTGVDKVTWKDYGENLDSNIEDLHKRLVEMRYRAPKVRRTYIPKANGKMRPLGIPCLEDKIVQRAVTDILNATFDGDFMYTSYGYRKNKGAKDTVRDLTLELQFGKYAYVVEADIKGFFDNLNHDWLISMIEERIKDRKLIRLIRKWLKAGILDTDGKTINPMTGTPQGGIVSPILANIYLHFALDLWFEKVIKEKSKGRCFLVRYADDFVAGFQFKSEADAFHRALIKRLGKFDLEVEPTKTGIHKFNKFKVDESTSFEFLGFAFQWQKNRKGGSTVKRTTSKKKFKLSLQNMKEWIIGNRSTPSKILFPMLRSKLTGYWNWYGVRGNTPMLKAFWVQTYDLLFKWLNRRSQRKSYTMEGLNQVLVHFHIPAPHITEKPHTEPMKYLWKSA